MVSLILTVIGPDRTGLVDAVAELVTAHQGNWLESRMSHLAGYFAGIVRIEVEADRADALIEKLGQLEQQNLSVVVRRDDLPITTDVSTLVTLELVGNDRPGIVREVSHVLAEAEVNVEDFQTECLGAPNSGATLFRARARLQLPEGLVLAELQAALEAIALDLMVDVQLVGADAGDHQEN